MSNTKNIPWIIWADGSQEPVYKVHGGFQWGTGNTSSSLWNLQGIVEDLGGEIVRRANPQYQAPKRALVQRTADGLVFNL